MGRAARRARLDPKALNRLVLLDRARRPGAAEPMPREDQADRILQARHRTPRSAEVRVQCPAAWGRGPGEAAARGADPVTTDGPRSGGASSLRAAVARRDAGKATASAQRLHMASGPRPT